MGRSKQAGFTLVELIVVIVITGVLSGVLMQFITVPVESYVAVTRRVSLVNIADTAMQRLSLDIKTALPNSIRIGCSGKCIEFLRAPIGGRYRASPPGDQLKFVPAGDTSFEVLGPLNYTSEITVGSNVSDCANNLASCISIYNTGESGADAWELDNLVTLTGCTIVSTQTGSACSVTGSSSISFNSTVFPSASPYQRFYLVDTPIKYICDSSSGTLKRYQNYNITSTETAVDTDAELVALSASSAMLADQISACSFSYIDGSASRNAILTISLTVTESSENITLLQQLNVVNQP